MFEPSGEECLAGAVLAAHSLEPTLARGDAVELLVDGLLEALQPHGEELEAAPRHRTDAQRIDDLAPLELADVERDVLRGCVERQDLVPVHVEDFLELGHEAAGASRHDHHLGRERGGGRDAVADDQEVHRPRDLATQRSVGRARLEHLRSREGRYWRARLLAAYRGSCWGQRGCRDHRQRELVRVRFARELLGETGRRRLDVDDRANLGREVPPRGHERRTDRERLIVRCAVQVLPPDQHAGRNDLRERRAPVLAGMPASAPSRGVVGEERNAPRALRGPCARPGEADLEVVDGVRLGGERAPARATARHGSLALEAIGGDVTVVAREEHRAPRSASLLEQIAERLDVVDTPWVPRRGVCLQCVVDGVEDDRDDAPIGIRDEAEGLFGRRAALRVALAAQEEGRHIGRSDELSHEAIVAPGGRPVNTK